MKSASALQNKSVFTNLPVCQHRGLFSYYSKQGDSSASAGREDLRPWKGGDHPVWLYQAPPSLPSGVPRHDCQNSIPR